MSIMSSHAFRAPVAVAVLAMWSAAPNPKELAPGLISTGHEFTVTFTPDRREVYFTRFNTTPRWYHVMHSGWKNGAWQPAEAVPFSEDAWADMDPALSPDGRRLYFVSTRPTSTLFYSERAGGHGKADLYVSERRDDAWSAPRNLGSAVNTQDSEYNPSLSPDGSTLYFGRNGCVYAIAAAAGGLGDRTAHAQRPRTMTATRQSKFGLQCTSITLGYF